MEDLIKIRLVNNCEGKSYKYPTYKYQSVSYNDKVEQLEEELRNKEIELNNLKQQLKLK